MRVDTENLPPSPLDTALGLLCRLAADIVAAPWSAIVYPPALRIVWNAECRRPLPPGLEAAALGFADPAPGAIETDALGGSVWTAAVALPGTGGRLMIFGAEPLRLDAEQRRLMIETAGLAAMRIAAENADPPAVRALARIGHFSLDRASGLAKWSREVYRLYGYDAGAGAPSLAMALAAFPSRAQTELRQGISRSWETGEEVSVASTFTGLDGARRDVLVRLRADDPVGTAPRISLSGIILDVTEARSFDERLERERELLRTTLDHMDQGIFVVETDMSIPVLSRRATELLGLPEAFLETRPSFPEILDYQFETGMISRETLTCGINAYILGLQDLPETHVYDRTTRDGRVLEVRTTRLPTGGFVRTFTDQTARRRRDEEIVRAQAEYRLLFENSVNGIYRTTPDGRVLRANPALARFSGYETEAEFLAAMGDVKAEWYVNPEQREQIKRRLEADGRIDDYVYEVYRHRTRERVWVSESAWVIRNDDGAIVAYEGTVIDATERKRAGDHVAYMARHDALTGLPNRTQFTERLEAALAGCGGGLGLAVLFFDLDRFKAVNDTLGHAAGDELLRGLAARIVSLLGPGDVVARFGGDEFALLSPAGGEDAARGLAERILAAVRRPFTLEGREIGVGASIGVALASRCGTDPVQLMKSADVALYRAKAEGRDTYRFFVAEMDAEVQERQRLEVDLREAIDRGEFSLIYQPVMCIDERRPVGYEALLRWTHPERGAVPPQVFIPIAEETRLIERIGAWVLARACADAALWPGEAGLWVNVSAVQLAQDGFEAMLGTVLAETGFAPARLVLEITETSLMDGRADPGPRLERLRALGLRTALDDFGTGYSSLGYLRRFAFDVIKIDQSFVRTLEEPETAAIVASVLDLAARLGMATVAEGVETEDQLRALREAGCGLVQGHLFGPPVAAGAA